PLPVCLELGWGGCDGRAHGLGAMAAAGAPCRGIAELRANGAGSLEAHEDPGGTEWADSAEIRLFLKEGYQSAEQPPCGWGAEQLVDEGQRPADQRPCHDVRGGASTSAGAFGSAARSSRAAGGATPALPLPAPAAGRDGVMLAADEAMEEAAGVRSRTPTRASSPTRARELDTDLARPQNRSAREIAQLRQARLCAGPVTRAVQKQTQAQLVPALPAPGPAETGAPLPDPLRSRPLTRAFAKRAQLGHPEAEAPPKAAPRSGAPARREAPEAALPAPPRSDPVERPSRLQMTRGQASGVALPQSRSTARGGRRVSLAAAAGARAVQATAVEAAARLAGGHAPQADSGADSGRPPRPVRASRADSRADNGRFPAPLAAASRGAAPARTRSSGPVRRPAGAAAVGPRLRSAGLSARSASPSACPASTSRAGSAGSGAAPRARRERQEPQGRPASRRACPASSGARPATSARVAEPTREASRGLRSRSPGRASGASRAWAGPGCPAPAGVHRRLRFKSPDPQGWRPNSGASRASVDPACPALEGMHRRLRSKSPDPCGQFPSSGAHCALAAPGSVGVRRRLRCKSPDPCAWRPERRLRSKSPGPRAPPTRLCPARSRSPGPRGGGLGDPTARATAALLLARLARAGAGAGS
ncbi:unnamed protein product, partial [Prorocentrum cordatum]